MLKSNLVSFGIIHKTILILDKISKFMIYPKWKVILVIGYKSGFCFIVEVLNWNFYFTILDFFQNIFNRVKYICGYSITFFLINFQCYDLRFPEFSLALTNGGAEILTYPSAFTQTTGMAHWEVSFYFNKNSNHIYFFAV